MKILKFGGTSVGSPAAIKQIIKIIKETRRKHRQLVVVVSAFSGITDQLIALGKRASTGSEDFQPPLLALHTRHQDAIQELVGEKQQPAAMAQIELMFKELKQIIHGVSLVKELTPSMLDFIMSFGERLSATIITAAFISQDLKAVYLDTREVILTDDHFGNAHVDRAHSYRNIQTWCKNHPTSLPIATGFIGKTAAGQTTTLGRGGSDYTAALFGAALTADVIEIWTDVNGVMTANPKQVPTAFSLPSLTYREAMEMSYFGAKVIHPPTMLPALEANIPLLIKNTFNPRHPGTLINFEDKPFSYAIKGISSIQKIAMITVAGSGLVGVAGMAERLFGAIARAGINIILITQASSEYSISFAVAAADVILARRVVENEYALELSGHYLEPLTITENLSIIAVVGENMRHTPGVSGTVFNALGHAGINVVAIAQGSSELNISVVIQGRDEIRALQAIHEAFFKNTANTTAVFVVGTGVVGGTLLNMIKNQPSIKLVGLTNNHAMLIDEQGIQSSAWKKTLTTVGRAPDLKIFLETLKKSLLPRRVLVDCTAGADIVPYYPELLEAGIAIVTPNKQAAAGPNKNYQLLKTLAQKTPWHYETNVGAGLPIITTLQRLIESGDRIIKIEGILSGTLSFLFNSFVGAKHWSALVKEARDKGFTESDPRVDLGGVDVVRKVVILARECGWQLETSEVKIDNLLPKACAHAASISEFFRLLPKYDAEFEQQKKQAARNKKVLRYIATIERNRALVKLRLVGPDHPFYNLTGSDNIVAITSTHYHHSPLVIRGPGAGPEVTAAGVLSGILQSIKELKSPLEGGSRGV